jgi:hypothetical protein
MSALNIRRAFEKRLALMSPALPTAYENVNYTPVTGAAYQRASLLPAQPENVTLGDAYYREVGLFQVSLYYPVNVGSATAETRAESVISHFKRGTAMIEGGQTVLVTRTPTRTPAQVIDGWYVIFVSIFYRTEVFS